MTENKQRGGCLGRRGCLGCLGLGLGSLIVLLCLLLLGPVLLRSLGIITSAEDLYAGAPDRFAGEQVSQALTDAGISGAEVYVLPIGGKEGQLAVITLDENSSLGGVTTAAEAESMLLETMTAMAAANEANDLGIERVTINYEGAGAESLVILTAPNDAVADYAAGRITRPIFLQSIELDYSNLLTSEEVQTLIEEAQQQ